MSGPKPELVWFSGVGQMFYAISPYEILFVGKCVTTICGNSSGVNNMGPSYAGFTPIDFPSNVLGIQTVRFGPVSLSIVD